MKRFLNILVAIVLILVITIGCDKEQKAEVETSQIIKVTSQSAIAGGIVTFDGNAPVTERGICWSKTSMPSVSDSHFVSGSGTGSFTCEITGLEASTDYYIRAYAINSKGTSYGNEVGFTTLQAESLPAVAMGPISNITSNTVDVGGVVLSMGSSNVSERGICWSTSHNPTANGNHIDNGMGIGNYIVSITNLAPGTVYYVRAYAKNNVGVAYSLESSFTTLQNESLPTVTTSEVINITQTDAMGGGNVISTGNSAVIERGVCWSTNHNPTTNGSHANNGIGAGNYAVNISGLAAGTTYYVRAYAINSLGTAYGNEVMFTTLNNETLPVVTTSEITNITQSTATGGGNVISTGNSSVTERGICWDTNHNPTISGNHAASGTGFGCYAITITGLISSTTYYVRAYAMSGLSVVYGNEVSFTTVSLPHAPVGAIDGLFSVSTTERVYFSQGNLQYHASHNTWQFARFQYDYIGNGNDNISSSYNGWIDLFGWGTSGFDHGAFCYQPWSTSQTNSDYYAYGYEAYNLYDKTGVADWGYNSIANGGNSTNQWRTLTQPEWDYVFNYRSTSSGIRYAKAKVNNVNGMVLVPDNWSIETYSFSNANNGDASYSSNVLTASQWVLLEEAGAVFLPASGSRYGSSTLSENIDGCYWSSSYFDGSKVMRVFFTDYGLTTNGKYSRYRGHSVRLVFSAE